MYDTIKLFLAQNISVEEISKKFPQIKKSLLYKYLRIYNLDKFKSAPQNIIYQSAEWAKLKELALRRDGYACIVCGHKGSFRNSLQLDHILPKSIYPEKMWDLDNVRILCANHHKLTKSYGRKGISEYKKQLKAKSKKK